jgi:hypothetical protein
MFTMFVVAAGFVINADAQTRRSGVTVTSTRTQPIVVRRVVYRDPFWRSRYWGRRYYDPFYDPYYYSPYLQYKDQETRLRQELAGNRRELAQHLRKYRADGVLTDKERRELDDDYRDVARSERRLREFNGNYAVNY